MRALLFRLVLTVISPLLIGGSLVAQANASPPAQNQAPGPPAQTAPPAGTAPATKSPSAAVGLYVYPTKQQDAVQQAKDEGECFTAAKRQTGWDPSAPETAPQQSASKQPSGGAVKGSARGAAGGAAIGAIAGDAGQGAAIGATAGAVAGRRAQRKARKEQKKQTQQAAQSQQQQQLDGFRRSMSACLEARGYTAK